MTFKHSTAAAAIVIAVTIGVGASRQNAPGSGARIVAVGDIHGAGDAFAEILATAGLVDANRRWIGGNATLVQTGDYFDRGPQVRQAVELLMRLEDEAKKAGGRVEALLGNHEEMNILREFHDVSPQAFASFADDRSAERQSDAAKNEKDPVAWMQAHPPGFLEYVEAIGPKGQYGRWLRTRKVVVKLDGTIFMHAGLRPDTTASLDEINRSIEREIRNWDEVTDFLVRNRLIRPYATLQETVTAAGAELRLISATLQEKREPGEQGDREYIPSLQRVAGIVSSPLVSIDGPLWYRGLTQMSDAEGTSQVQSLLDRHQAVRFVIGHTPALPGRITPHFGGRVFAIDTGMLSTYFKGGRASALELKDGRLTAIYTSGREVVWPPEGAGKQN